MGAKCTSLGRKKRKTAQIPRKATMLILPELSTPSSILSDDQLEQMYPHLPLVIQSAPWILTYTTEQDGYCLSTAYRKLEGIEGSTLLVLKECQGTVLGVLTAVPLRIGPHCYSSLGGFLFTFKPSFRKYGPTCFNENSIYCDRDYVMFGASENGLCGLRLDDDFNRGASYRCRTYDNQPLADTELFKIISVEIWTFSSER